MKKLTATAIKNKFVKKVKLQKYNKTQKIKTTFSNNKQTSNWFGNWTNFFSFK